MKILITGGCGFVGSNLCIFLKKKNTKLLPWIICQEKDQNII